MTDRDPTPPRRPAESLAQASAPAAPASGQAELDAAFAAMAARAAAPSPGLMARVMADAVAQAKAAPVTPPARRGAFRPARGWRPAIRLPRLRAPVGLATALAAGFVLGAVAPATLFDPLAMMETALFGPPLLLDFADAAVLLAE